MIKLALPIRNTRIRSDWKHRLLAAFCVLWLPSAAPLSAQADQAKRPIRLGLTAVILHEQYRLLTDWREYLQRQLHRPVEFITRDSYGEAMDLLQQDKLDFAWISDYLYVRLRRQVRLVAVPQYLGRPYYRSYLIVSSSDTHAASLVNMRGGVFVFSDPYSNAGYLAPRFQLLKAGEDSNRFFRKTFFTWSNSDVVEAVADGVADAGAVSSFVWDSLAIAQPDLTARTRIAGRSPEYGFPPVVANRSVGKADFQAMQRVLFGMAQDPDGAKLLKGLNIDRFAPADARLYQRVAEMMRALGEK